MRSITKVSPTARHFRHRRRPFWLLSPSMAPLKDPRRAVGNRVHALAVHIKSLAGRPSTIWQPKIGGRCPRDGAGCPRRQVGEAAQHFVKAKNHIGGRVYKTKEMNIRSGCSGDPPVAAPTAEDIAMVPSTAATASVPEQEGRLRQEEEWLTVPRGEGEGEAASAPAPPVIDLNGTKWVQDNHATIAALINSSVLFPPWSQTSLTGENLMTGRSRLRLTYSCQCSHETS